MKEGFNIIIKDNFLDEKLFNKLHEKISYFNYDPKLNFLGEEKKHPWFSAPVSEKIKEIIKDKCEKTFRKRFKVSMCNYTLLASVEPLPHNDLGDDCDHQICIYIKGNTNLNKGTGFYLENGLNTYELNTHIGFNENRAILWESNTFHSPLNWSSDDKSKRYSIICFLKEIKN
jgi:hypothetical protein